MALALFRKGLQTFANHHGTLETFRRTESETRDLSTTLVEFTPKALRDIA